MAAPDPRPAGVRPTRFTSRAALEAAAEAALRAALTAPAPADTPPRAVMLAGGRTPLPVYARLAADPPRVGPGRHLILSDERHVPDDAPLSNYAQLKPLIAALALPPARVLRPRTDGAPDACAAAFAAALDGFAARGGIIEFALLGMGADGHIASLFTRADAARAEGPAARVTRAPDGLTRLSVGAGILRDVRRVVLLVAGADKGPAIARLLTAPASVPAGLALGGGQDAELWYFDA